MSSPDPNPTLYIYNIKGPANIEEIRVSLYGLFATYGPILDIVTKKTEKMREQAFVVYADIASATTAKRSLTGFTFLGHPLKIEFAKTKSDAIAHLDGTYKLRNQPVKRSTVDEQQEDTAKRTKHDEDEEDEEDDSDDDHA